MTAFAAADTMLFNDPHLSRAAWFRPGGGAVAAAVRVMLSRPDAQNEWSSVQIVRDTHKVSVRISDVPALAPGDRFELLDKDGATTGEVIEVQGEPLRDGERLIWVAEGVNA